MQLVRTHMCTRIKLHYQIIRHSGGGERRPRRARPRQLQKVGNKETCCCVGCGGGGLAHFHLKQAEPVRSKRNLFIAKGDSSVVTLPHA
jgi:hypothetical protein